MESATDTTTKLNYRRGTARRTLSVDMLSIAVQLYEKWHLAY